MDGLFLLLIFLVTCTVILRFVATAARNSAREDLMRQIVEEHRRMKRLDELYGRDKEERK